MTEHEKRAAEAQVRLAGIAKGLALTLGPDAAVRLLGGAMTGLLLGTFGRSAAIEYLEDQLAQVREEHPENFSGPASDVEPW